MTTSYRIQFAGAEFHQSRKITFIKALRTLSSVFPEQGQKLSLKAAKDLADRTIDAGQPVTLELEGSHASLRPFIESWLDDQAVFLVERVAAAISQHTFEYFLDASYAYDEYDAVEHQAISEQLRSGLAARAIDLPLIPAA